jgi:glycosyltransferase involved in cell wall biosynthesis
VRYLEPCGWRSTVVTTRDQDYWILDPTLLEEIPQSAEVLRVGGMTAGKILLALARAGFPVQEAQGARRSGAFKALRSLQRWMFLPDAYRGWSQAALRAGDARLREGGIDALWTTSSPESAHLAGLALRKKHHVPWVADFRDPWVGRVTYRSPTPWHEARHRAMERRVVHAADRVTLVSEALVALYRKRYPDVDPSRFVYLPNGFDSDDWRRALRGEDRGAGGRAPDRSPERAFVLLHAGQLAHRPTVHTLLDAARRVVERDPASARDLRLRFLGGNEEIGTQEEARYGLGPVLEIRPSRPHIESLAEMSRASALLLLGHGGAADALLYTGKIYEYLSSGRPVIAILDEGPAADLIRSTAAGIVFRPGDTDAVAAALENQIQAWRAGKDQAVPIPPERLAHWERRNLASQAAGILTQITSPQPRK